MVSKYEFRPNLHVVATPGKFAPGGRIIFQAGDFYRRPIGGQYDLALASHVFYRPLEQVEPVYRNLARVIVPGGVL